MSKKYLLICMISLFFLVFSGVVLADDLGQSYQKKYQACIEQKNDGYNLELTVPPEIPIGLSVCFGYTDETTCVNNDCIWDDRGTPDPDDDRCYSAICQADSNLDGKVTGADLAVFAYEYGRMDCPEHPAFNTVPKTGNTIDDTTGEDGDLQKGVTWPNPRFTDNEDGTVTDNLTGLMWAQYAYFSVDDWTGAVNSANNLTSCGYDDWRIPNVRELLSVIHFGVNHPAISNTAGDGKWTTEGQPFTGHDMMTDPSPWVWTSTTVTQYHPSAWAVSMYDGDIDRKSKDLELVWWPVRGGQ